jgi:hypothetical protein
MSYITFFWLKSGALLLGYFLLLVALFLLPVRYARMAALSAAGLIGLRMLWFLLHLSGLVSG